MPKSIEIEIKVQIENSRKLKSFLKKNAKFEGINMQTDIYYCPKHKDYTAVRPVNEWLRLRDSSGKYSINYKNWYREKDGRSNYCDEHESPVESITQLKDIFNALEMKELVKVVKTRKTWLYKDFEISIDSVEGLGDFVEIEYKGNSTKVKPAEVTEGMVGFLKDIGVGKISRNYVGYPYQMLFPKEVNIEEV